MGYMRGPARLVMAGCIFILLSLAGVARAGEPGTAGAGFLKIRPCARPVAMGGAYAALADDVHALYYNPGGLGMVRQGELTMMHNEYLADINHEYLALVYPGFHGGTLGLDLTFVDLGSFQQTTIGANNAPVLGRDFSASDLALSIAYGRQYNTDLAWGLGLKFIREQFDDVRAQTMALDAGLMYKSPAYPGLSLGMALQNIGPQLSYQARRERLPLVWRGGVGYRPPGHPIALSAELSKAVDGDWAVGLGGEYAFAGLLALRAGYNSNFDAGSKFTCGAGFNFSGFSVDYAWQPGRDLGDVHRVSLNCRFGQAVPAPSGHAAAIPLPVAGVPATRAPAITPRPAPGASVPPAPPVLANAALAQGLIARGEELARQGDMRGAVGAYLQALRCEPRSFPAYYGLGNAAYALGDYSAARDAYSAALRLRPDDPSAMNNLGSSLYQLREYAAAARLWERVLAADPGNSRVRANLERLYARQPEARP